LLGEYGITSVCGFSSRLNSLPELVQDGRNGLIFNNSEELADQIEASLQLDPFVIATDLAIQALLTGFPQARRLEELRRSLDAQERTQSAIREWGSWQQNWDARVRPLVEEDFQLAADAFLEQVAQRHQQTQRARQSFE